MIQFLSRKKKEKENGRLLTEIGRHVNEDGSGSETEINDLNK